MTNPTIDEYIRQGDAAFSIRVGCGATYYREVFKTHEARFEKTLPSATLSGEIEVRVHVCSLKPINPYKPVGLHEDYESRAFSLRASDFLAVGPRFRVQPDKKFDPLAVDVSSIMRIVRGKFEKGPFRVNLDWNQIRVELSEEDHASYGLVSARFPGMIHGALVLPVLYEAIVHMQKPKDEQDMREDLTWFKRLSSLLQTRDLQREPALVAAQKLLESPFSRVLADARRELEDN